MPSNPPTIGAWRGVYHATFKTSAAIWEAGAETFENFLTNGGTPSLKVAQALDYAEAGTKSGNDPAAYGFAGTAILNILPHWIQARATYSRPELILRLAVPVVVSQNDWDYLLSGTPPPGGGGTNTYNFWHGTINNYIVAHNGDSPGNNASHVRIRIGWEMNGAGEDLNSAT